MSITLRIAWGREERKREKNPPSVVTLLLPLRAIFHAPLLTPRGRERRDRVKRAKYKMTAIRKSCEEKGGKGGGSIKHFSLPPSSHKVKRGGLGKGDQSVTLFFRGRSKWEGEGGRRVLLAAKKRGGVGGGYQYGTRRGEGDLLKFSSFPHLPSFQLLATPRKKLPPPEFKVVGCICARPSLLAAAAAALNPSLFFLRQNPLETAAVAVPDTRVAEKNHILQRTRFYLRICENEQFCINISRYGLFLGRRLLIPHHPLLLLQEPCVGRGHQEVGRFVLGHAPLFTIPTFIIFIIHLTVRQSHRPFEFSVRCLVPLLSPPPSPPLLQSRRRRHRSLCMAIGTARSSSTGNRSNKHTSFPK